MKKLFLLFSLFLLVVGYAYPQKTHHSFEIVNGQFLYDGKPMQIHSGEMHYSRIPREYWRHRFRMMKAMGLNTVATYVFWNYHNIAPGVWDFKTSNRDIAEYIRVAQEEGLFVILRPGPYVCAEWEFGGYPWWLQNNKDLIVRTNQAFLDSCKIYINKLAEQVRKLQASEGGPIIMVQVENEFGSYTDQRKDISIEDHRQYYLTIKQFLLDAGFKGTFFTSDGSWLFNYGAIPGILPTANGENDIDNLRRRVDKHYPGGPYMVAEYYPGWIDHWAEAFTRIAPEQSVEQIEKYLKNQINFNIYMVHGGTNFGYTAGANYDDKHGIQPDITSYDYDAPITEAGWASPKYLAIRDLMRKYIIDTLPDIPERIPVITIPDVKLSKTIDFFEWGKTIKPALSNRPLTFEELGQGSGYVIYGRRFSQPIKGKMRIVGLRDYAIVYVNGKRAGELNRVFNQYEIDVNIPDNGRLEILVENMGRINYGAEIPNNKKGIIFPITIDGNEISDNWEMYKIPMSQMPDITLTSTSAQVERPAIYAGVFKLKKTGDTFLDMHGWGKGVVFVNGYNLGRYWKVGPQQTLYLPGCWLKEGKNEVVIFEQQNDIIQQVLKTTNIPVLEELVLSKN